MTTRRVFIESLLLGFAALGLDAHAQAKPRILIAYFSQSGNTRLIAQDIAHFTKGELFEIQTKEPIVGDFDTLVEKARADRAANRRPVLAKHVTNMSSYDVVFVGFPNWVGTMPMPVFSFLEQHNFKGKTIVPFCTHGTSGISDTISDLVKLNLGATIAPYFDVYRGDVAKARDEVGKWIGSLNL